MHSIINIIKPMISKLLMKKITFMKSEEIFKKEYLMKLEELPQVAACQANFPN